jgi:hypothetical protein
MRPSAHHPHHPSSGSAPGSSPFPYGAASPAEFASNLQHLQHLHSVQQQIAAAAAASSYWTSLKSSALAGGGTNNGTPSGRDGPAGLDHSHQHLPPSWRYDQHGPPLSSSPLSLTGKAYNLAMSGMVGMEPANKSPTHPSSSVTPMLNKRKRSSGSDDDGGHNSSASFNHDGQFYLFKIN